MHLSDGLAERRPSSTPEHIAIGTDQERLSQNPTGRTTIPARNINHERVVRTNDGLFIYGEDEDERATASNPRRRQRVGGAVCYWPWRVCLVEVNDESESRFPKILAKSSSSNNRDNTRAIFLTRHTSLEFSS